MRAVAQALVEAGIELPEPLPVRGRFRPVVVHAGLAHVSGAIATTGPPLQVAWPGRVGAEVSLDDAKRSARGALLGALANLREALGTVDRIEAVLHVRGFVCVDPSFDKVHHVVGAATELVGALFGDDGLPARTAVGVAALPERASVVIDLVAAVAP